MSAGFLLAIYFFSKQPMLIRYETEMECTKALEKNIDKYGMKKIQSIDCFELYLVGE